MPEKMKDEQIANQGYVTIGCCTNATRATHIAIIIIELLAKMGEATLRQPSYNLDMALADFFLFPKIKRTERKLSWNTGGGKKRFQGASNDWVKR